MKKSDFFMKSIVIAVQLLFLILISLVILPKSAYAVSYTLNMPSGQLSRGDNFTVTVNIDTQGETLTQTEVFVTYDTSVLQYVSTSNGGFFPNLYATDEGTRVKLSGNVGSGTGKTGSGVLAYITFTIIATSPGSTTLCAIVTPTPAPTSPPSVPTSTPYPTSYIPPTVAPTSPTFYQPTTPPYQPPQGAPPVSGSMASTFLLLISGTALSALGVFLKRKIKS